MSLLIAAAGKAPSAEPHIERHAFFKLFGEGDWALWFSNHLLMSLVASGIGLFLLMMVARAMQPRTSEGAKGYLTKGSLGGFFELILVYLRDETVRPLLHEKTDKYIGFLWSLFFFILFGNILGIIPIGPAAGLIGKVTGIEGLSHLGGTFTGNWNVTIALSVIACIVWLFAGLKEGGMGYIKHYWVIPLKGQPMWLVPLLVPIGIMIALLEVAGNVLIKPFALCVRLLANMMAGHLVLGSLVIMSLMAFDSGGYVGAGISFLGALAIYFLELFVSFLQAYIFMFLTAIFISLGLPHGDHGHEEDGHGEAAAAH